MLRMVDFNAPTQLPTSSVMPLDTMRSRCASHPSMTNDLKPNSGNKPHPNQHPNQQQQHQQLCSPNPADEFHLSIPAYLTKHGRTLGSMDQKRLAEVLKPVMLSLRLLNAESLLALERVDTGARLRDGVNVRPIHDEVMPQYDMMGGVSCVRYIHITEVPEQYSIGIFVFPPFARIPLHDHPEMCVLSRLLYGDLQCLSLDLPGASPDGDGNLAQQQQQMQQQSLHPQPFYAQPYPSQHHQQQQQQPQLPPGLPQGSRRAYKNPIKHLHAPDVSLLFPYKGNLHEFFAGPNGAAVLDILLPPYDCEHDRDCTFYDIREDPAAAAAAAHANSVNPQQAMAPMMDAMQLDDDEAQNDGRAPCWIVPTDQPHDFHCLSGQYHKLGAHVVSMQDASTI